MHVCMQVQCASESLHSCVNVSRKDADIEALPEGINVEISAHLVVILMHVLRALIPRAMCQGACKIPQQGCSGVANGMNNPQ